MSLLNMLYTLIIYPPRLFIEIIYELFYKIFTNQGIAVLGVSVAVTFLSLPLYIVAEKWQKTEREIQKRLAPKIAKIKAVFKGDERYMILSTYYRQNHYHPLYALRSSFGILVQIPFFIAAFSFLSNLESLKGISFLFINDMGAPDSIAQIGGFTINILPILMTVINIVSGILYSRGFPLKDKVQIFGIAVIFLIFLYNSPAALVIYWTMNNIFSLVKNIFYKIKNPLKILYIICAFIISVFILYMIFINNGTFIKRLFAIAASSIVFFIPLLVKFVLYFHREFLFTLTGNPRKTRILFISLSLALAILAGLSIPSAVISTSPEEFSFIDNNTTPLFYLGHSFLTFLGLFSIWPICVYFLFGEKIKSLLTFLFGILFSAALINAFIFQGNYGIISNLFQFENTGVLHLSLQYYILNIFVLLLSLFLFIFVIKKKFLSQLISVCFIVVFSLGVFSVYNMSRIQRSFHRLEAVKKNEVKVSTLEKVLHLSRDKPNIVVIMADRAINSFVKPIFDSRPELYSDFEGFILYPNTVSYASNTILGVPPIWGGFEYTPMEMNKRDTVTLKEKHNQSLLMLPVILAENDFDITVTDSSFANHELISDLSIFDGIDNIKAINTKGRYTSYWFNDNNYGDLEIISDTIKRNCVFFSFFRIIAPPLRFVIYDKGKYLNAQTHGYNIKTFIDNYAVIDYLPELTSFNSEKSQALFITNDITHDPYLLKFPDYEPVPEVTDFGPGSFGKNDFYHINAAFFIRLSRWLRTLKEEGVYDNTRIVLVSDHGSGSIINITDTTLPIPGERLESYNPLLMVKDFNNRDVFSEKNIFMTNADVPILVLNDIIDNPVNPFTGNYLSSEYKKDGVYITINNNKMPGNHGKYKFNIKKEQWLFVKDNIFESSNWKAIEK